MSGWQVTGASVRGSGHDKSNLPCQDSHAWETVDDIWLIAAVADGAGSAKHSDIGSITAVEHAIKVTKECIEQRYKIGSLSNEETIWQSMFNNVLQSTLDAVIEKAKEIQKNPRELASTFLLAVIGPSFTAAVQIGDGGIVVEHENGEYKTLTYPEPTEYVNETTFLVSPNAINTAQIIISDSKNQSVALFSDRLQMLALKYPEWEPFEPFFKPIFTFSKKPLDSQISKTELTSLLMSPRVRERSDDDITLLLASHFS